MAALPYPALAGDLDVLFTLASVHRCHQIYLRTNSPFSAFTFFSLPHLHPLPSSNTPPPTAPLSGSYQRRGFKPSCAAYVRACRRQRDNAVRERNAPLRLLAAA